MTATVRPPKMRRPNTGGNTQIPGTPLLQSARGETIKGWMMNSQKTQGQAQVPALPRDTRNLGLEEKAGRAKAIRQAASKARQGKRMAFPTRLMRP